MYLIQREEFDDNNISFLDALVWRHYFARNVQKIDIFIRYLKDMPIHQWYRFNENDKNADDRNDLACSVTSHNSVRRNLFRLAKVAAASSRFDYTFFCDAYVFNYRLSTGKLISTFCQLTTGPEAIRIRNIDGATNKRA